MRVRLTALLFVILGAVLSGYSQARTVTNADLEKYREARLKAESDYRENCAKLGLPSPEELARRREKSLAETEQLAEKLRMERLQTERLEYERYAAQRAVEQMRQSSGGYWYGDQYYPYGAYGVYGTGTRAGRRPTNQAGYYAGGQFWPVRVSPPQWPSVWLKVK